MMAHDALRAYVLDWVIRQPLIGEPEIARWVAVDEPIARGLLHELTQWGWCESLEPGSRELEARRRYIVRPQAVPVLAAALGCATIERDVPVGLRDVLQRVARFEITVGVNGLLAELADHLRQHGPGELADARSLPLGKSARQPWWLVGASGYGCLRTGDRWAPFLVVWDRAAAPDDHRRVRVRAWLRARASVAERWAPDGLPPTLLVCPGEREQAVWERDLLRCLEADPFAVPSVLLATRESLRTDGVGGSIWRRPGDLAGAPLSGLLGWGGAPLPQVPWMRDRPERLKELPGARGPSLRAWARDEVTRSTGPHWQRIGALAVVLVPGERLVIEWLVRFPLLAVAELAALTGEPVALIARRVEWLIRCGAIRVALRSTTEWVEEGRSGMDRDEDRYVLTDKGIRFLAERAGVSPAALRSGGARPTKHWAGEEHAGVRHVEHTIGVNRFLARLAVDARDAGGRLAEARNDAESAHGFTDTGGRNSAIRPDASGIIEVGEVRVPFLLEYDRGTLDAGDFRGKFEGYRRYYEVGAWTSRFEHEPLLLFVCVDQRAERRVLDAARAAAGPLPLLAITEGRCEEDGTLGASWQTPAGERRGLLMESGAPSEQGRRDA